MKTKILATAACALTMMGAGSANAVINAPVPADNYITFNGNDWAWAAPCAPYDGDSCGPVDMTYQSTQGWRIADAADFLTGPTAADFGTEASFKCASAWFDTVYTHCDYGDGAAHAIFNDPLSPFVGNPAVETWVIRSGSGAVPEPASWAMFIGGFGLIGAAMRRRAVKVGYAL